MRLLSKKEVKSKIGYKDIFERIKNQKEIKNSKDSLVTIMTETESKKHELQREFDAFVVSIGEKKEKLLIEVDTLEKKKAEALEPLEDFEEELYRKQSEQEVKEESFKTERNLVELEWKDIAKKRDEIEREHYQVKENNKLVDERIKAIEPEEKRLEKEKDKLQQIFFKEQKVMNEAHAQLDKRVDEVKEREKEAQLYKQTLELKEKLLIGRERDVEKKRKHVASQQQSLKAAYALTRSKNID